MKPGSSPLNLEVVPLGSSPSPVKARLKKHGKIMSIIFCDSKGIKPNYKVPAKTTVNREYYSHVLRIST